MAKFDARGREIPDPTPIEVPAGARRPETLQEMVRRFMRVEMSKAGQAEGFESFEEADDFDVGDDDDLKSEYELDDAAGFALVADPAKELEQARQRLLELEAVVAKAAAAKAAVEPPGASGGVPEPVHSTVT